MCTRTGFVGDAGYAIGRKNDVGLMRILFEGFGDFEGIRTLGVGGDSRLIEFGKCNYKESRIMVLGRGLKGGHQGHQDMFEELDFRLKGCFGAKMVVWLILSLSLLMFIGCLRCPR